MLFIKFGTDNEPLSFKAIFISQGDKEAYEITMLCVPVFLPFNF
jgi:hypothetical protein